MLFGLKLTDFNSILYLRGLYPPQDFETTTIYGVKMIMSINPELKTYIKKLTEQLQGKLAI